MSGESVSTAPASFDTSTYISLLQQTYDEALTKNELNTNYWIKTKEEYKTLLSHLEVLPNDVSKEVMVPVGSKALMKGKMVHTNEILVCLGDGWFVKQSAMQAAEICKRRMQMCDDMLSKLENERTLLTSRKELPFAEDAFGNAEGNEILEVYDEEKEAEWRVRHRQKEREYRKKLSELRKKEKPEVKTEEDLWKKLDDLELQEELEEELDRLHADDSEEEDYDSEYEESDEGEEEEDMVAVDTPNVFLLKSESDDKSDTKKEFVIDNKEQESKENEISDDINCNGDLLNENPVTESKLNNNNSAENYADTKTSCDSDGNIKTVSRRVSFKSDLVVEHHNCSDSEAEESIRIEFKHSSVKPMKSKAQNNENVIDNPADIYNHYSKISVQSSAPKSILKRTHSGSDLGNKIVFYKESDTLHLENDNVLGLKETELPHDMPIAVQVNVVERGSSTDPLAESHIQPSRPVSRFRAARSNKR